MAERARDLIRQICAARGDDCAGSGVAGSHSFAGGNAAAVGPRQAGAVLEGPIEPDVAGGISSSAQAVLRSAFVGEDTFARPPSGEARVGRQDAR